MLRSTASQPRRSGGHTRRSARRPSLEALEDRTLLDIQLPNLLVNDPAEDGRTARDTQSETTLVLGANHTVVVAYNDTFHAGDTPSQVTSYSQSTDGGFTFADKKTLPVAADGDAGDPVLAADTVSGRIYLSSLSATGSGINVYRSDDNGATFQAPVNGAPRDNALWDKDWLTVDNFPGQGQGTVYLVARDFGSGNGILLFRSTDGGDSWTPNGRLVVSAGQGNLTGAWVAVGPDHAVYVGWYDERTASERIMIKKSTDGGLTFGTEHVVTTLRTTNPDGDLGLGSFRSNAFPQVAVNPDTGALYVVYNNKGNGSDRADIFFRQSTDGGATWSAAVRVNDDTTTRDQWQPALAVNANGHKVGIFWYDRRNDRANTLIDRYGAIGTVAGNTVTFAANFRVTEEAFPPVTGVDPAVSADYMGDYDQVVATQSHFYLTWGDNRSKSRGHAGNNADIRYTTVAAEVAGPSVIATTPTSDTFGDVSRVRIAFDEAIQVSTFTADQVVSFTGPDGPIAVTGITVVPNTGNAQFDIAFATQHSLGQYTMVIGPGIVDADGRALDQNENGTPGESLDDQFAATFTIQGPKILANTPADKLFGPVSSVRLTFNEPVDPATVTPASVSAFRGPNGFIDVTAVSPVAGSNNTQFDVSFSPQGTIGRYTMVIGPGIRDVAGHQMDQNGNFIEGEFPGDAYEAPFAIVGPAVLSTTPNSTTGSVFSLRVTFNEPMNVSSFMPDKITSFTGPTGPISVLAVMPVPGSKLTQFDVVFPPQTAAGHYTMMIGPYIRDVFDNSMDQDGNLIPGEFPDDQFMAKFNVPGPHIIASTPPGLALGSVDHVRVTFSEPIDVSTFTPDKIASFTGPQGAIPVTGVSVVPFTGNTQFDIRFDPSGVLGSYSMVIGPDIRDVYGNRMDQDSDFIPGETPGDQFTTQFGLFAVNVINNGDFEVNGGGLDGWTIMKQTGSSGDWFIQTGTTSPLSNFPVPEPPGPANAAMTDSFGPGAHVMFQDFVVPRGIQAAMLSFDRFIGNQAGVFVTPNTLDFTGASNQQARVDILSATANPFSVLNRDVLLNLFQTAVGDPATSGYTTQTTDLTAFLMAHEGQTLRLRFAMTDNLFFFQFGVDRIILAVNSSPGGAAAVGRGKVSKGQLASASAAIVPGAAVPLGIGSPEVALAPSVATSSRLPLATMPDIDRFFASTAKQNEARVFMLPRSEQVNRALEGPWQVETLTEIFGKDGDPSEELLA